MLFSVYLQRRTASSIFEKLFLIRVLRVLKDSGNNLRNIGSLVVLSRSNLQTGIFIAGQQRREAAGILSAGAVIDESCNELVTDQIVDDNVEGVLRKQRIFRSRSAISIISARFNGRPTSQRSCIIANSEFVKRIYGFFFSCYILLSIFISHIVSTNPVESNISIFLFLQFVKGFGIKKLPMRQFFQKFTF